VSLLVLDRGNVTDRLQKAMVVEPPHPLEGGELNVFQRAPGPALTDDLRLEEAYDRLGQGVVVGVARLPTDGSMPASAKRSV
jgi:hypothetical protein